MPQEIDFPDLCANCGSRPGAITWPLKGVGMRIDPWSLLTILVGRVRWRSIEYRFSLPICDVCTLTLQKRAAKMRLMSNVGTVMFFVGLWGLTAVASREQDAVTTLLAILLILAVVLGSAAIYLRVFYAFPHLFHYNYNGKFIRFAIPDFHRAFAALNPEMVAPKERPLKIK